MPDEMTNIAYIGLGSNMGDREHYLLKAIEMLDLDAEIRVALCSNIYETAPVGYVEQAPFLNMVIRMETKLRPQELLVKLHEVETLLGRQRDIRWGPRTLDLDLLLYNDETMITPDLIIPHPRMYERAFVLIPLADVILGEAPETISAGLEREDVRLWRTISYPYE